MLCTLKVSQDEREDIELQSKSSDAQMDDVIGNMEGPIIKDKAKDPLVLPCKIRLIRLQHLLGSKMDKTNQTAHMGLSFHTLPESNKGQEEKENLELPSNCVEVQTDNGRENVKDKV